MLQLKKKTSLRILWAGFCGTGWCIMQAALESVPLFLPEYCPSLLSSLQTNPRWESALLVTVTYWQLPRIVLWMEQSLQFWRLSLFWVCTWCFGEAVEGGAFLHRGRCAGCKEDQRRPAFWCKQRDHWLQEVFKSSGCFGGRALGLALVVE